MKKTQQQNQQKRWSGSCQLSDKPVLCSANTCAFWWHLQLDCPALPTGLGVFPCALNILKTVCVEKKVSGKKKKEADFNEATVSCPWYCSLMWAKWILWHELSWQGTEHPLCGSCLILWNFSVILLGIFVCPTVNLIPWAWGKGHEVEEDQRPEQTLWENRRDLSG